MASSRITPSNPTVYTYGPSGQGHDYTEGQLATWENDTDINLVSAAAGVILDTYSNGSFYTDSCTMSGTTTNTTYFRLIRAASGHEHGGIPGAGVRIHRTTDGSCISVWEDNGSLQDIEVTLSISSSTARAGVLSNWPNVRLIGLIISAQNSGSSGAIGIDSSSSPIMVNCLLYGCKWHGIRYNGTAGARIYNCTSVNNQYGVYSFSGGTVTHVKNCLMTGSSNTDMLIVAGTNESTNNATEDGSATGANAFTNQTFTFVNAGSNNFHLSTSDAGARNKGTDLSGDSGFPFDDDIDGDLWVDWDIGFDEPQPSVPTVSPAPAILPVTTAAPTISGSITIASGSVPIPIATVAPSVVETGVITPAAVSIPISTVAHVQSSAITRSPSSTSTSITTVAPTLSSSIAVSPTSVSIPVISVAPTIVQAGSISPDSIQIPVATVAPNLSIGGITITPSAVATGMTTVAPSLSASMVQTPGSVSTQITSVTPNLSSVITRAPASVAMPVLTVAPSLVQAGSFVPDPVVTQFQTVAPSVTASASKTPDAIGIPITIVAPTESAAITKTLGTVALPILTVTPSIVQAGSLVPDPVTLTIVVASPSLVIGGVTRSPSSVTLSVSVSTHALASSASIAPNPVDIPIVSGILTLAETVTKTPDPVVVASTIVAPTFSIGGVSRTPSTIAIPLTVPTVSIGSGIFVAPASVSTAIEITSVSLSMAATLFPAPVLVPVNTGVALLDIGGLTLSPNATETILVIKAPGLFQGLVPTGGLLYDLIDITPSVLFDTVESEPAVPLDDVGIVQSF